MTPEEPALPTTATPFSPLQTPGIVIVEIESLQREIQDYRTQNGCDICADEREMCPHVVRSTVNEEQKFLNE
ncbi:hypothetical protein PCE1_000890 [Barthelona sp. PCE]